MTIEVKIRETKESTSSLNANPMIQIVEFISMKLIKPEKEWEYFIWCLEVKTIKDGIPYSSK